MFYCCFPFKKVHDSRGIWFAVLQKRPVVLPKRTLACPFLNTQMNRSKGKNKNEPTDEFGADQLGACIHINTSTPGNTTPAPTLFPTPSVHVCVFLWQPQDACTTTPMNRDVFYFSVQCLCINWAWRGARGCPSGWLPVFSWQGWLFCLRGLLFRLLCADGEGKNVTSQKRHALNYVNSK